MLKAALNALGVDIVKYPLSPLGRQLRDFFRNNSINLVIDVGASDGHYCRLLRTEAEYSGPVVSFEPCLRTFQAAQNKMASDPNWFGFQIGLSDAEGEAILNTFPGHEDWNSLHQLRSKGADAYKINERSSEKISLRTLDGMWSEVTRGIDSPCVFLKMDTQGHDVRVMEGSANSLPFIVGIQSEVAAIEMYDGMLPMGDVIKFFDRKGYTPIGFFPVPGPNVFGGAVPEFDVVFRRTTQE
jgi:FkbM family methyltransferase